MYEKTALFPTGPHNEPIVHFTVTCLVAKPLNKSEAKGDLVMIQTCCYSNAGDFVIMLTRYWSLSQHGQLQPHSKSKAWQLRAQLENGPFIFFSHTYMHAEVLN